MLGRVAAFAFCAIALALFIGQAAPSWMAEQESQASASASASSGVDADKGSNSGTQLSGRQVALRTSEGGHVIVDASVDNRAVTFLIDTGATMVALNERTAARLGFHPSRSDYIGESMTANGSIAVAPITIREIRIANIVVRDVPAVVIGGDALDGNLLGMSFLNRLRKFEFQGDQLVLSQ